MLLEACCSGERGALGGPDGIVLDMNREGDFIVEYFDADLGVECVEKREDIDFVKESWRKFDPFK